MVYFWYTIEITTVKIHKNTKSALDELKIDNETYDDIINRLISQIKNKNLKNELIKAYKNLDKEDLDTLNEWESASSDIE